MKCFHPYDRPVKGEPIYNSFGVLIGYSSRYAQVPCGHCAACLQARRQSWAFRIQVESDQYPGSSFFVSLTYDDNCLPYGAEHPTLCKSDLTEFFHRLRSYCSARDPEPPRLRPPGRKYFRYFACGEYGDSFGRPHYHFVFWDIFHKWSQERWLKAFQDVWKFCQPQSVDIEDMSPQRAEYVAKYCLKQVGVDYKKAGVEPPFAIMSRRPGIGENFNSDLNIKRLRSSGSLQVFDSTGTKFSLPRYYRTSGKFFTEDEIRSIQDKYQAFQDKLALLDEDRDPFVYMKRQRSQLLSEYNVLRKLREDQFGKSSFLIK